MGMKKLRGVVLSVSVLMLACVAGCVLLIPAAIIYYSGGDSGYTAKVRVDVPVGKVYATAVGLAAERAAEGRVTVTKQDDANRSMDFTDGKQTGMFKVVAAGNSASEITVTASVPKAEDKKTAEKELAMRIIGQLCERLNVRYTITKQ
jgi:hypothetical protein